MDTMTETHMSVMLTGLLSPDYPNNVMLVKGKATERPIKRITPEIPGWLANEEKLGPIKVFVNPVDAERCNSSYAFQDRFGVFTTLHLRVFGRFSDISATGQARLSIQGKECIKALPVEPSLAIESGGKFLDFCWFLEPVQDSAQIKEVQRSLGQTAENKGFRSDRSAWNIYWASVPVAGLQSRLTPNPFDTVGEHSEFFPSIVLNTGRRYSILDFPIIPAEIIVSGNQATNVDGEAKISIPSNKDGQVLVETNTVGE